MRVLVTCRPMAMMLHFLQPLYPSLTLHAPPNSNQNFSEHELKALLPGHDAWIAGDDPVTGCVLASSPVRVLVKWGAGTDNVDVDAVNRLDIPYTNTPALFGESVSDLAVGMLLNLTRHITRIHDAITRDNTWLKIQGIETSSRLACIVGLGCIGRCIARKLAAFNCRIVCYDPCARQDGNDAVICGAGNIMYRVPNVVVAGSLADAVAGANFLILTCNLTSQTHHMVNIEILEKLDPLSYVINVSRGAVISEADLLQALERKLIMGAGLDVFEHEPLQEHSPLRQHNVIFGSHNGSNTYEGVMAASRRALDFIVETNCAK